ncbi:hypothetical protein AVEN_127102-1 [Araneus ventricosus]|uniref:Uncharacterized protein n=1 Tax=Araneus ventricosus TaxID=182803 RepID=A0A4Y2GTR0_ARAVE|nr:hypothetical protein AVEN_127102-1 [Araneus ventricosus]
MNPNEERRSCELQYNLSLRNPFTEQKLRSEKITLFLPLPYTGYWLKSNTALAGTERTERKEMLFLTRSGPAKRESRASPGPRVKTLMQHYSKK